MQQICLNEGKKLDISTPLKKFVKKCCGKQYDPEFDRSINTLQESRDKAIAVSKYSNGSDIDKLKTYYKYLTILNEKFPMLGENCISISWKWKDGYNGKSYTVNDMSFEMANVVYNIGALYSQAALNAYNVQKETIENITSAIEYLRNAALFLLIAKDQHASFVEKKDICPVLCSNALDSLRLMCIAQGQQLYVLQAKLSNIGAEGLACRMQGAADKYKEVYEKASKTGKLFTDGFIKHFELSRLLTSAFARHYQGESIYTKYEGDMNEEKAHCGELARLSEYMDNDDKEIRKFMSSFRMMEVADKQQCEEVLKVIKEDSVKFKVWHGIYYLAKLPADVERPQACVKMRVAEDMKLYDLTLNLPIPDDANVSIALDEYNRSAQQLIQGIMEKVGDKKKQVKDIQAEYLLPDILSYRDYPEGFTSSVPQIMESRIRDMITRGGASFIQGKFDLLTGLYKKSYDKMKEMKKQSKDEQTIKTLKDVEVNLNATDRVLKDIQMSLTKMSNDRTFFRGTLEDIVRKLPVCTSFDCVVDCSALKSANDKIEELLQDRVNLVSSIKTDKRGEAEVRTKIMEDKSILNLEITKTTALTFIKDDIKKIEINLDLQDSELNTLKKEYKKWCGHRKMTPEMVRREKALITYNQNLNIFENCVALIVNLEKILPLIENTLKRL